MKTPLARLSHTRSSVCGGDIALAVMGWDTEEYAILVRELTAQRVKAFFGSRAPGPVSRFELPALRALTFVLHDAAGKGLALRIDPGCVALASALLLLEVESPIT